MEKKKRCYHNITDLPSNIHVQILIRLPLESILVCRRVCKLWDELIIEPSFAKLHRSISPLTIILQCRLIPRDLPGFRIRFGMIAIENNNIINNNCDVNYLDVMTQHMPSVRIAGSCNGLVCLSSLDDEKYDDAVILKYPNADDPFRVIICNPVLGSYFTLPEPPRSQEDCTGEVFGFGYIPSTGQYKAVKMDYLKHQRRVLFHVYTMKSGFMKKTISPSAFPWRTINYDCVVDGQLSEFTSQYSYPVFFKESIIWIAELGGAHEKRHSLIYFDIQKEQMQTLMLPPTIFKELLFGLAPGAPFYYSVVRVGVYYDDDGNDHLYLCEELKDCANIWVMEDYKCVDSLKLKWIVQLPSNERVPVKLFKVLKDGKLLIEMNNKRLARYDPNTGVFESMWYPPFHLLSYLSADVPNLLGCML